MLTYSLAHSILCEFGFLFSWAFLVKLNNIGKARFILLLLAMLAYSVQSFAFAGHMGSAATSFALNAADAQPMPSSQQMFSSTQKMQGCHGRAQSSKAPHVMILTTGSSTKASSTNDCCEDGCTMIGCHIACALVSSLRPHLLSTCQTQKHSANLGLVAKRSSSFYRPPIFR